MKSSELLLALVIIALIIGAKAFGIELDQPTLIALVTSTGAYSLSRGLAKMPGPADTASTVNANPPAQSVSPRRRSSKK